jgi:hypothetical protein
MSTDQLLDQLPSFRDQCTRLKVFGIFQILLGCFCLLMTFLFAIVMILPVNASAGQDMNVKTMIPVIIYYIGVAVCFIWLGIGSILARRWAWTLTVILSWIWFIFGLALFIPMVYVMSKSMDNSQQVKLSSSSILIMHIISLTILLGIYILLPALFLLFYNRASVRATCQQYDPKVRWTDRCPMPVLAISVLMVFAAFSTSMTWPYNFTICLFGVLVSGVWGAMVSLLMMTLFIWLAFGTYKLKMAAWWGTLLLWLAGSISMVVTFCSGNMMKMYEQMGYSEKQMEMMRKVWADGDVFIMMICTAVIFSVVAFGYMLYVRRYFVRNTLDIFVKDT